MGKKILKNNKTFFLNSDAMKDLGQISCFNQTHYDILYSAIKESRGNESIDSAVLSTFGLIAGQFKIML